MQNSRWMILKKKLFLGLEIEKEGSLGDSSAFRDIGHADLLKGLVFEEFQSAGHNCFPAPVFLLLASRSLSEFHRYLSGEIINDPWSLII